MGCTVGRFDQDAVAFHHIQDVEPSGSTVVGHRARLHHKASDLEEHLGQLPQELFVPTITVANGARRLDQVPLDGGPPPAGV
jgi:hypothetical protein